MNVYQVMGIIVGCTSVFAGVVTILAMQGIHILLALSGPRVQLTRVHIRGNGTCFGYFLYQTRG